MSIDRILIVTGGRTYNNRAFEEVKLAEWQPDLIIHGGASGADRIAHEWAQRYGVPVACFWIGKQQWSLYGRGAGPLRNQQMIDFARSFVPNDPHTQRPVWDHMTLVEGIAMPGGGGTADMCHRMREAGITYWDYRDDPDALGMVRPRERTGYA